LSGKKGAAKKRAHYNQEKRSKKKKKKKEEPIKNATKKVERLKEQNFRGGQFLRLEGQGAGRGSKEGTWEKEKPGKSRRRGGKDIKEGGW